MDQEKSWEQVDEILSVLGKASKFLDFDDFTNRDQGLYIDENL